MAELHVERTKRSNTLWIVLGVLIIALVAWLATRNDEAREAAPTTQGTTTGALPVTTAPVSAPILLHT